MLSDGAIDQLRTLVETPSPSGYEQPVQRLVRQWLTPLADSVDTDVLGNVYARLQGEGPAPRTVMITAHCDEIGLMITQIDDRGFLNFAPIGGVDPHLVPGQRVRIHARAGALPAVVGKRPIHLTPAKEREALVPLKELFIDAGFASREEAEGVVALGDPVTFAAGFERLAGDRATCRALDDKVGAFIVTEAFRRLAAARPAATVLGVTTVQEEVGLRGGTVSGYSANPDVALVVEVGHATDVPHVDARTLGAMTLGGGPVLVRGANVNPVLFELLRQAAEQNGVPCQTIGTPGATGTDAKVIQLSRSGVATALIRVPLRYMHSTVEVLSLTDVENSVRLLTAALPLIATCPDFIPL